MQIILTAISPTIKRHTVIFKECVETFVGLQISDCWNRKKKFAIPIHLVTVIQWFMLFYAGKYSFKCDITQSQTVDNLQNPTRNWVTDPQLRYTYRTRYRSIFAQIGAINLKHRIERIGDSYMDIIFPHFLEQTVSVWLWHLYETTYSETVLTARHHFLTRNDCITC